MILLYIILAAKTCYILIVRKRASNGHIKLHYNSFWNEKLILQVHPKENKNVCDMIDDDRHYIECNSWDLEVKTKEIDFE